MLPAISRQRTAAAGFGPKGVFFPWLFSLGLCLLLSSPGTQCAGLEQSRPSRPLQPHPHALFSFSSPVFTPRRRATNSTLSTLQLGHTSDRWSIMPALASFRQARWTLSLHVVCAKITDLTGLTFRSL